MNFSFPKPSNRVTTAMVIGLLVIIVVITVDLINKNREQKEAELPGAESQTILEATSANENNFTLARIGEINEGDSDGDGLFDWEEELRGTDKNNKDTDGDGTNDKDETETNRDPLIPGPDDSTLLNEEGVDIFADIIYKEGTLSDQVGKTFIENYLKIGDDNSSQLRQFSQQLAGEAAVIGKIENKYSEIDFQTFPNFEEERVREYGNLFALYYIDYRVSFSKITTNTPNYLQQMNEVFETFIGRISTINIPRGAIEMHTNYVNNIEKTRLIYNTINLGQEDPLRAYYAVGQFQIINEEMPLLLRELALYFEENSIIYTEEEIGIFWQKI